MRCGFSPPVRFPSEGYLAEMLSNTSDLSRGTHRSGAEVAEPRSGHPNVAAVRAAQVVVDTNEPLGMRVRQRTQKDCLDDGKHRHVRAEAECQGQYGRCRKSGALTQPACRVATIVSYVLQPGWSVHS